MLAGPNPRWKRTSANASRCAMVHRTVRGISSAEVPSLYGAGKSLSLGNSGHVHEFPRLEAIDQHAVAGFGVIGGVIQANFSQTAHGRYIRLLEVPHHGFRDALRLDDFHQTQ